MFFVDDKIIIQQTEDSLQQAVHQTSNMQQWKF